MRVVVAPDSYKGTLTAPEAATALAAGWTTARPRDEVVTVPLSDGGDGLLEVVASTRPGAVRHTVEVADPLGHPRPAAWLQLSDGTAVIESAEACGLHLVARGARRPLHATTYGVGQLLDAARAAGSRRVLVGLGGSATVDGGAGAVTGLGFRVTVEDGSGLKVGAADLHRVRRVARGWAADWSAVEVDLLADVTTRLLESPARFALQKGAAPDDIRTLEAALAAWADVAEGDLAAPGLRERPGSGAAGGLGFGLAAAVGGRLVPGAGRVLELVGLPEAVAAADLVLTGEGRLDATSSMGKVVGSVLEACGAVPVVAVVGRVDPDLTGGSLAGLAEVVEAPGSDPAGAAAALRRAAAELAGRRSS